MRGQDLLDAMGYVDDRFVEEAERRTLKKVSWPRYALAAACLCAIVLCWPRSPAEAERTEGSLESATETAEPEGIQALPGTGPEVEMPSVMVRVEDITDQGFSAVVTRQIDTDLFPVGMELRVVVDGSVSMLEGERYLPMDMTRLAQGAEVTVLLRAYDEDTATIWAGIIKKG